MQFLKEHLAPGNYEWSNELIYTGDPSRRLYNRNNGDQLLFVINSYAAPKTTFNIEEGQLIQGMLKHELPVEAKSERSVLQWLNEKWLPDPLLFVSSINNSNWLRTLIRSK